MTGDRTAASKDAGAAARKPATSGRSRGPDARFGLQDALGNRGVLDRLRRPAPAAAPVSVSPAGPGVQRKCAGCGGGGGGCSACTEEKKDEFPIHRKARSADPGSSRMLKSSAQRT